VNDVDDGVARLESVLGGTRVNAERALRELHQVMARDLRRAERRAERAERRVADLRGKLRRVRRRAEKAERRLRAAPQVSSSSPRRALGRLKRRVQGLRRG
jgi:chromosome segregation ATPase